MVLVNKTSLHLVSILIFSKKFFLLHIFITYYVSYLFIYLCFGEQFGGNMVLHWSHMLEFMVQHFSVWGCVSPWVLSGYSPRHVPEGWLITSNSLHECECTLQFFSFHHVDSSRVRRCLGPQAAGPGWVQEGCSPEPYVQSRARKDLWHKLPPKKQKRQCFLKQSWEIIPQKTEWGSEYGGGTKHSWIIGFVLCSCSTWPHNSPSLKKKNRNSGKGKKQRTQLMQACF